MHAPDTPRPHPAPTPRQTMFGQNERSRFLNTRGRSNKKKTWHTAKKPLFFLLCFETFWFGIFFFLRFDALHRARKRDAVPAGGARAAELRSKREAEVHGREMPRELSNKTKRSSARRLLLMRFFLFCFCFVCTRRGA